MRLYFLVVYSFLELPRTIKIDSQIDIILCAAPNRHHSCIFKPRCHLDCLQSDTHEQFFSILPGYQGPHGCLDPLARLISTLKYSILIVIQISRICDLSVFKLHGCNLERPLNGKIIECLITRRLLFFMIQDLQYKLPCSFNFILMCIYLDS